MKKIFKSNLKVVVAVVITAIICITGSVYAAREIFASNVSYEPSDTTWKKTNGEDIENVEDAINELYTKAGSECISNSFDIVESCDTTTGCKLLNFNPSVLLIYYPTTSNNQEAIWYYNSLLDKWMILYTTDSNRINWYLASKQYNVVYQDKTYWDGTNFYIKDIGGEKIHQLYYMACK